VLGNEDLTATLTATGIADVTCTNPAGNVAPGQRTSVTTTGTQSDIEVKNGRATFNVTTAEPGPLNPAEVCPNRKWTATITDVEFTSATLTLIQGGSTQTLYASAARVLTLHCPSWIASLGRPAVRFMRVGGRCGAFGAEVSRSSAWGLSTPGAERHRGSQASP
jgi:hypothetical protein